eukprot:1197180-Rhodomonas_salina.5
MEVGWWGVWRVARKACAGVVSRAGMVEGQSQVSPEVMIGVGLRGAVWLHSVVLSCARGALRGGGSFDRCEMQRRPAHSGESQCPWVHKAMVGVTCCSRRACLIRDGPTILAIAQAKGHHSIAEALRRAGGTI